MNEEQEKLLQQVKAFLYKMIEIGGSDLYIKSGSYIYIRVKGEIHKLSSVKISRATGMEICRALLRSRIEELIANKEVDFTFKLDENYRFRANAFFQLDGPTVIMRIIPAKIPSLKELNMPNPLYKFINKERGLVLVTGVTGSGKSTTLAAMINEINQTKRKHIITIEDPIEFVHKEKNCVIEQRSIGQDTLSFANALRSALREDPDIILIGEMRDLETIEIALHAAETGHLVFSTLHTLDATETINRIISMFPSDEQNRVRIILAEILEGVISQRLIKTIDGKRVAAMEILVRTARIADLIREDRDNEIKDALEEGREVYGTQTFDDALVDLVISKKVTKQEALRASSRPDDLELRIKKAELEMGISNGEDEVIDLKLQ
jgi:twitching motility protein PilT